MSQTFTNWKNDPVHFTVACASKLNMCVALHSVNDPRSIYDYEAFLLYFFALADLGLSNLVPRALFPGFGGGAGKGPGIGRSHDHQTPSICGCNKLALKLAYDRIR